jgi:hypothetical protein
MFWVLEIGFGSVQWFVVFEFLTLFTLGGDNFLISNLFSTIGSVSDVPRRGFQLMIGR